MHRLCQGCCSQGPAPCRADDEFKFYDAQITGANSYGNTSRIFINNRVAFEGQVVGGDACHCSTMSSRCGCAFPNREDVELKVANPGIYISSRDIRGRELARDIVKVFNSRNFLTKKAYVHAGLLFTVTGNFLDRSENQRLNFHAGEKILIDKKFFRNEKFNSNNGSGSAQHDFPDFLSHWSYVNSGGDHLLCNLQGHRGVVGSPVVGGSTNYYLFKDPVILSRNRGTYGISDTGQRGINNWLNRHQCNWLCTHFNLAGGVPSAAGNHATNIRF